MSVLIIAAHPDDEVLGCGGTIARLADEGQDVSIAFMGGGRDERQAKSSEFAAKILGARVLEIVDNSVDNEFDLSPLSTFTDVIDRLIQDLKPEAVYSHWSGDINQDHRRIASAVAISCRPLPGKHVPKAVYAFEVPGSSEWSESGAFKPNVFVDIKGLLGRKHDALRAYDSEVRQFPHPRSTEYITALAWTRGAQSGLMAAEGFMLQRLIN